MEWPRIKTMILTILLITNIGLLSFVLQRAYQGRQMQQEARENAILFLHNSGIEVDPAAIPGQMGLLPQTVKRDREQESRIASALLGGAVQELSWGAEAFRYYNEKGYLQFHRDGALKGEFVEGEFPIQEPESMDYTQQVLRLLEFEGDVVASTGTAGEEAVTTVVVKQSWKGAPLPGADLHPHHPVPVLSRRHRPGRCVQPDRQHHRGISEPAAQRGGAVRPGAGVVDLHRHGGLSAEHPHRRAEPG